MKSHNKNRLGIECFKADLFLQLATSNRNFRWIFQRYCACGGASQHGWSFCRGKFHSDDNR